MSGAIARPTMLKGLTDQAPVLLACAAGLILALVFRRKARAASLWAAGAFTLGLFTCGFAAVAWAGQNAVANEFVPYLRGATYLLLIVGVYAVRLSQPGTSSRAGISVWQSARESI